MRHEDFVTRLSREVERRVGPVGRLRRTLETLHAGFTTERGRRAPDYQKTPEDCLAYLALSGVTNAVRTEFVLRKHQLGLRAGERGLDIGAGIGVSGLALAARSHRTSEIHLVDQSAPALDLATRLFKTLFPDGPRVVTHRSDLSKETRTLPGGEFEITVAGHVLNELLPRRGRDPGPARDVALAVARRSGTLVILEPAQRLASRSLSRVRGALLEARLKVLGPCPHSGRCPVLAPGAKDWCVTDVPFRRPPVVEKVDSLLDLDRRSLTVSYLALRKTAQEPKGGVMEVLSEAMRTPHGTVIYLCSVRGRVALTLPTPPQPKLYRGTWIRIPKGAKPSGKDKSGAPRVRVETEKIERLS